MSDDLGNDLKAAIDRKLEEERKQLARQAYERLIRRQEEFERRLDDGLVWQPDIGVHGRGYPPVPEVTPGQGGSDG